MIEDISFVYVAINIYYALLLMTCFINKTKVDFSSIYYSQSDSSKTPVAGFKGGALLICNTGFADSWVCFVSSEH